MVQLNPAKWGSKSKKKKEAEKKLISRAQTRIGTGRSAAKRQSAAQKEATEQGLKWKKEEPKKVKKIGTGRWAAKNMKKRQAEADAKAEQTKKKKKQKKSNLRITTWRDLE